MQSLLSSLLRTVFFTICFVVQCFCLETRNFNCLSNTPDGRLGCKRRTRHRLHSGSLYCGLTHHKDWLDLSIIHTLKNMSNPYPDSIISVGVCHRDYHLPTTNPFWCMKMSKQIDLSRKEIPRPGVYNRNKDRNQKPNKSRRKKPSNPENVQKPPLSNAVDRIESSWKQLCWISRKKKDRTKIKNSNLKSEWITQKHLQLPNNNPLIRNTHTQEDSNGPIP